MWRRSAGSGGCALRNFTPGKSGYARRPPGKECFALRPRSSWKCHWLRAGGGQAGAARDAGAAGVVRGASVSRAAGDVRVEILLKNGRSLRVGPGFDAELVRALLAVVESAA